MYRVEDKFSCSEAEMFLLKTRLQSVLDTDTNQRNKAGYQITSVYFDDYWDSCLQEAIDGVKERCKYRIRIYDDKFDVIKLEIKYKKSVSTDQGKLTIRGKVNKIMRNVCVVDVTITDAQGDLCTEGTVYMFSFKNTEGTKVIYRDLEFEE